MNIISKGLAVACLIMGFAFMRENMPIVFVQHMQGLILMILSLVLWANPWRKE